MEHLLRVFRALSEEIRIKIILLLSHGELCVCDLMELLDESQPKVSRHLAYLKHSGLIKSKRLGPWMYYSLREPLALIPRELIRLLSEQLPQLPRFQKAMKKMDAVKKKNQCQELGAKLAAKGVTQKRRSFNGSRTR